MRSRSILGAFVFVMVLAACDDNPRESEPTVTPAPPRTNSPISTSVSTSTPDSAVGPTFAGSSTTEASSTSAPVGSTPTTPRTAAPPGRLTPEDLGPLVDPVPFGDVPGVSAPGEIVEVFPLVWLYLPSEPDPADPNIIVPKPQDIEILTAYGRAWGATIAQASQFPVPVEPSPAVQAAFADGGAQQRIEIFEKRNAEGTYVGSPEGRPSLLRPYVLTSPRSETEALVFDCQLVAGDLLDSNGNPVSPSTGGPYGAPSGSSTRMIKVDGVWKVADTFLGQPGACS